MQQKGARSRGGPASWASPATKSWRGGANSTTPGWWALPASIHSDDLFTKFMFVVARREDAAVASRLRAAGSTIARGFFNDFDADGAKETQPHENIQFLIADGILVADSGIAAARYAV